MITLIEFIFRIVDSLLGLLEIAVIVNAVVSWLVAFQVINMRNQAARSFVILLDRLTRRSWRRSGVSSRRSAVSTSLRCCSSSSSRRCAIPCSWAFTAG